MDLKNPSGLDFDTPRDRRGTDSQKWRKYDGRDILPLWVADMDIPSPPAIIEALHERAAHGIFGYAKPKHSNVEAVLAMLSARFNWEVDPAWLVWLPGLVLGLNLCARTAGEPGDAVMVNTPVYPPFLRAPLNAGRELLAVPLREAHPGRWEMDFEAMERAVTPRTRLFILCNPHNPAGRVFSRAELGRLAEFCARHNLVLCSDEIHCDLVLEPGLEHVPAATLDPDTARRTITLISPSKTYNIPGLCCSLAVIPGAGLRAAFHKASAGLEGDVNTFGYTACEVAYRSCEPWRRELLRRLRGNRDHLAARIARDLPGVRLAADPVEATYLAWLDVRALRLADPVAFFEEAGVGLSDGRFFGAAPGEYVRLNFGCPPSTLDAALGRMAAALHRRGLPPPA